jgi:membrane associated rhomboid family serine protease
MFSLFFLGRFAEKLIGRKRFFWLYIISGLIGSIAFVLFAYFGTYLPFGENVFGGMQDSAVGASGALFGILGLLAMIIPFHAVYLIVGPLIILVLQIALDSVLTGPVGSVISFALTLLLFITLFAMFSSNPRFRRISLPVKMPLWVAPIAAIVPLVIVSFFVKLPIGNSAHFGGLLVGLAYGLYLRLKYKKKIILLQRYFR